eukprot:CAMPEP_0172565232 /NCGR_PEP_ID=MMETSP1067-20121228/107417_1 /TAXON_ID=265564 ORGANISM="Thalassiosira punctigera, Strain Tpunct2005C2" /NCGR_SAMPLE_ID=MMETSP1067 /ASSEMBLY_ACC=CAM_ASM_000444 /LENGTH=212 /DNA_ID=CAMNT_0013356067 /DNA_START=119 /DNA_END=757 /DNA_ORIENTATION=+
MKESGVGDTHIFLRFSPLIGGPAFLPFHVEVVVAIDDARTKSEQLKQKIDTVCVRKVNNLSSISYLNESTRLHRFDFLPENPTDPSTLFRLISFQGVPGRVRYRIHEKQLEGLNNLRTNANNGDKSKSQDGRGVTILIPVGHLPPMNDKDVTANDVLSAAIQFKDEYSNTLFKDLRIIGGKNCFSFALDLLSHVEFNSGMQRIRTPIKFDIE